jgi:hypothetical protein
MVRNLLDKEHDYILAAHREPRQLSPSRKRFCPLDWDVVYGKWENPRNWFVDDIFRIEGRNLQLLTASCEDCILQGRLCNCHDFLRSIPPETLYFTSGIVWMGKWAWQTVKYTSTLQVQSACTVHSRCRNATAGGNRLLKDVHNTMYLDPYHR